MRQTPDNHCSRAQKWGQVGRPGLRFSDSQHWEDRFIPSPSKEEALRPVCRDVLCVELWHCRSMNWSSHWEVLAVTAKAGGTHILRPGRPLRGTALMEEMRREQHLKTNAGIFLATSCIPSPNWKPSQRPSIAERTRERWDIRAVEYYAAFRKDELLSSQRG